MKFRVALGAFLISIMTYSNVYAFPCGANGIFLSENKGELKGFSSGDAKSLVVNNSDAIIKKCAEIDAINATLTIIGGATFFGTEFAGTFSIPAETHKEATISTVSDLRLTMSLGSRIEWANREVELKATDSVFVFGRGNVINVSDKFTINGNLFIQPFADLAFEYNENDLNNDSEIIFSSDFNLTLSPYTRLAFKGKGTTRFVNNFEVYLQGQDIASTKPRLTFADSALFTIQNNGVTDATVTISGKGTILVDNGGEIRVEDDRHLIIGSGNGPTFDDISISVDRDGILGVEGTNSVISMNATAGLLDFEQGGLLSIRDGGLFEINALNEVAAPGTISSIKFDREGTMFIEGGGRMLIGENLNNTTFAWDNSGGEIEGTGEVGLVGTELFRGRPIGGLRFFRSSGISAENIVRKLVNTVISLPQSTVFQTTLGLNLLRVKSSDVIVSLIAGDVVNSEDANGVGGLDFRNETFRIDLNGLRT